MNTTIIALRRPEAPVLNSNQLPRRRVQFYEVDDCGCHAIVTLECGHETREGFDDEYPPPMGATLACEWCALGLTTC